MGIKEEKDTRLDLFKSILPAIMQNKSNPFENDDEIDKFYERNSYIVNKALSMHLDCVMQSNMMNLYWSLPGRMKHDFFMASLRGYKRRFSYAKAMKKPEAIQLIQEQYNCNKTKALEYLNLLSDDDIEVMRKRLRKGGAKNE